MLSTTISHTRLQGSALVDHSKNRIHNKIISMLPQTREEAIMKAGFAIGFAAAVTVSLVLFTGDAAAQTNSSVGGGDAGRGICNTALATYIKAGTGAFAVLGPTLGGFNMARNMSVAASTNKSNKKKEAKENIRSSAIFGLGAGLIGVLTGLATTWGPISYC